MYAYNTSLILGWCQCIYFKKNLTWEDLQIVLDGDGYTSTSIVNLKIVDPCCFIQSATAI